MSLNADLLWYKIAGKQLPEIEAVCSITADLSNVQPSKLEGSNGTFWRYEFQFVIFFEGAKMKGRLEWMEGVNTFIQTSI
jgi:hypothetical protein